jgi:hypothetical protein
MIDAIVSGLLSRFRRGSRQKIHILASGKDLDLAAWRLNLPLPLGFRIIILLTQDIHVDHGDLSPGPVDFLELSYSSYYEAGELFTEYAAHQMLWQSSRAPISSCRPTGIHTCLLSCAVLPGYYQLQ